MQQMHVPTLTKSVKALVIAYVGTFLIQALIQTSGISLVSFLGLSLSGVTSGLVTQLLTFPLIETSFISVLFNALLLWFLGSDLELKWGTRFFIKFVLVATLGAAVFFLGLTSFLGTQSTLFGMTALNLAFILAYALIYSERTMVFMFLFPMKAKYFCMILAAIQLYMGVFTGGAGAHAAWASLAGMATAFAFLKFKSFQARGVSLAALKEQHRRNKLKSKLTLIKNDEKPSKPDPDNPKYWQ